MNYELRIMNYVILKLRKDTNSFHFSAKSFYNPILQNRLDAAVAR